MKLLITMKKIMLIEISEKDDMSIIEMFYKHITDKELSDTQSKKIKNILENELRKED